jgi:putative addiction module killer protein
MIEILQAEEYAKWFARLKDRAAKARIDIRIRRVSLGNFGDVKPVGAGISELRIPYEPGYRKSLMSQAIEFTLRRKASD